MKTIIIFFSFVFSVFCLKDNYSKYIDKKIIKSKWVLSDISFNSKQDIHKLTLVFNRHVSIKDGNILYFEIKDSISNKIFVKGQLSDYPNYFFYDNKINYSKEIKYKLKFDSIKSNEVIDFNFCDNAIIKMDTLLFVSENRNYIFLKKVVK